MNTKDREAERAAIVAYVWKEADDLANAAASNAAKGGYEQAMKMQAAADNYRLLAHDLERGDHLRGEQ